MPDYIYNGEFSNKKGSVNIKLILIQFIDEDDNHIIYSPHLDLSGYGENTDAAKTSFEIALEDFIDYTLKKNTFTKLLKELGWSLKGSSKKPKKILAPSLNTIIKDNEYVSEIFDNYPVNTFHQQVQVPAFA